MLVSKAAHRYAVALLGFAKEDDVIDETLKDVNFIKHTIDDSRELMLFLKSPIIKPDKKASVLNEIFADKLSELVSRFVNLVVRKNRQSLLDQIVEAFIVEYNKFAGIINAEIFSARKLDTDQVTQLTKQLEDLTGKKVNIQLIVQPELKGGLAVKIDDTVIDGTVKHKLEQLEETLLQSAAE